MKCGTLALPNIIIWNKLNAIDGVKKDPKISIALNTTDQEQWARRNYYLRLKEIGKIFTSVFGLGAYNRKIFLIFAEWTNFPQHYDVTLTWAYTAFGISSNKYLYALAQTHYFSDSAAPANANIEQILAAIKNSSDTGYINTLEIGEIASVWGLKLACSAMNFPGEGSARIAGTLKQSSCDNSYQIMPIIACDDHFQTISSFPHFSVSISSFPVSHLLISRSSFYKYPYME